MLIKEDKKLFNRDKLLNHNFNVLNLVFTNKQIDANDILSDINYMELIYNNKKLDYFNAFNIENKMYKSSQFILQNNKKSDMGFDLDLHIRIMKNVNSRDADFSFIDSAFQLNEDEIEINEFSRLANECNCNYLFINLSFCFIDPNNYIYFSNTNKIINVNKLKELVDKLEEDLNFINNYFDVFSEHSYFKFNNTFYYLDDGKFKLKEYDDMRFNKKIYRPSF